MKNSRGMSLVEVLISMVISLVVTLAAYQTFAASEGYRRAATGGGDATFSGSIGMYSLQRDLRMAGYGINSPSVLGCTVLAYDAGPPTREFTFTLAPVVITQGAAGASDTLEISYSSSDAVPVPVRMTQAPPTPITQYFIESGFGIVDGQLLVVAEPGRDCSLHQATNTPSLMPAGQLDRLRHVSGTYVTPFNTNATARYNKPDPGLGPNYSLAGIIYSIGQAPVVNRYYLQNENLVVDPVLLGNVAQPVAAGIVQLQAQYGRDTNADGVIDVWNEVAPATPVEWTGLIAVRLGLVARSAVGERANAEGNCEVTTVAPTWAGGNFDLSARADWRCFRYRVFESTISLRNMIWRPA